MTWPASVEALRVRMGWHAARRLVAARTPRAPVAAECVRRILVVLPGDADDTRAPWPLIEALRAPLVIAVSGDAVGRVPDAYAGTVVRTGDTDWRGLPGRAVRARLWAGDLDVAISLAAPDDLVASLLVGAAPAGLRIGTERLGADSRPGAAPGFFDLAVRSEHPAETLLSRLRQISPAVVPLLS